MNEQRFSEQEHEEIKTENLVDEYGSPIPVPADKEARLARDGEQTLGATGPTNWWRIGVILLFVLVVLLVVFQFATGGSVAPQDASPDEVTPSTQSAPIN